MAQPLPMTTSACSAVPATLTLLLPPLTSFLLAPLAASFSATPLTTRGIGVWTSPPTASSLVTSSSTKTCFPLLAPPHQPISTPSSSPIRLLPPHPQCLVLRRCLHLVQPRPHRLRSFPRLPRPRRPCLRLARPRRPLRALRDSVDPACATRGPVDYSCATRDPVDLSSLRRPCARLPPSRPRHYLGAC
jgi:hypothetical protein